MAKITIILEDVVREGQPCLSIDVQRISPPQDPLTTAEESALLMLEMHDAYRRALGSNPFKPDGTPFQPTNVFVETFVVEPIIVDGTKHEQSH